MTAPAAIKQADLRRMASIAKSEGVRVEVEIAGKIIRVIPDIPDIPDINRASEDRPRKRLSF